MAPPAIALSPMPPVQGQPVTITYTGTKPATLTISWDPAGTPTSVTITTDAGTTVTVPANATSVIVTDPNGGASAARSVISPAPL